MDRSEGEEPKGREVTLFQAQDGGKPRVAQPSQRDSPKRSVTTKIVRKPVAVCRGLFYGLRPGGPTMCPGRDVTTKSHQKSPRP